MKKRKQKIQEVFDPKKLFDWWSVPHFMFGIVTALFAISFSWSVLYAFFWTLILALLWELLEKYVRLSEAPGNGWVDVVLALLGFVITLLLVDQAALNHERHVGLFTITLLLYGFINLLAWRARFEKDQDFLG
ncbi:MAG: hypothetical protein WA082_03275, partial [Candidatus Moraniibacteriota bacterium]